jgi:serine/threonine protein phosphatase PrpC
MLEGHLPELATDLVEEVKKRGGTDDITVLIAYWD